MQSPRVALVKGRFRASGVHLAASSLVALLSAWLVFGLWYPFPFREISGGRNLFLILVGVDVVMGPLITLVIFDHRKPWVELRRDLCVVVVLQLSALVYGVWSVYLARPVQLVYEYGQFGVAHAAEIDQELVFKVSAGLAPSPLARPGVVSLRAFRDSNEQMQATLAALGGAPLAARADLWQSYDVVRKEVPGKAKTLAELRQRYPQQADLITQEVGRTGVSEVDLRCVPLAARGQYWTVLVHAASAEPVGYLPLDIF